MKGNVLILTYWSYHDALIQTYTLPYVQLIRKHLPIQYKITIVTLEKPAIGITQEELKNYQAQYQKENIELLPLKYIPFGIAAILRHIYNVIYLSCFIVFTNVKVLHAWCSPAGGLGWILSKITRRKLVVDSFEPHADPMIESGTWKENSLAFKTLFELEKRQARDADLTIGCVAKMQDYSQNRLGVSLKSFYWKPACIDFSKFSEKAIKDKALIEKYGLSDKIVCVYAGKFGGSYLRQEVFDLLKVAADRWKDSFRVILLNNQAEEELKKLAKAANFDWNKVIKLFVPHHKVPYYMGLGDFALTPFIPVPSKRYGSPIKTGEYWALGLPVITTKDISDDSETIENNQIGYVLQDLNTSEYTKAINTIGKLITKEQRVVNRKKIIAMAKTKKEFALAENVYQNLYGA